MISNLIDGDGLGKVAWRIWVDAPEILMNVIGPCFVGEKNKYNMIEIIREKLTSS